MSCIYKDKTLIGAARRLPHWDGGCANVYTPSVECLHAVRRTFTTAPLANVYNRSLGERLQPLPWRMFTRRPPNVYTPRPGECLHAPAGRMFTELAKAQVIDHATACKCFPPPERSEQAGVQRCLQNRPLTPTHKKKPSHFVVRGFPYGVLMGIARKTQVLQPWDIRASRASAAFAIALAYGCLMWYN